MAEQYRIGQQFGNYRLDRLLGQGGFAEVYVGTHLRLQRPAAIKILHAHLSGLERAAFEREAQIIAGLNHPHIVRVLDFDIQQGIPFLVMEYLSHGTLRHRHPRGERIPLQTILLYVKQVAQALQYAHEQRLIHRDVKPENMLVGQQGEIVLSDFGIAAIAHNTTSRTAQEALGTIPYMAPEQIQAQARAASDQYALGVVVYEWLSGERPFEGSFTEVFAKHLMMPPPPLRTRVADLPLEVEQVVLTALAKDPHQRFQNIETFATALHEASQASKTASETGAEEIDHTSPSSSPPPTVISPPPTVIAPPLVQTSPAFNPPAAQTLPSTGVAPSPLQTPSSPFTPPPAGQALPLRNPSGRKFSRRAVTVGLSSLGVIALGGGMTWWLLSPHPLYIHRGHSGFVYGVAWSPDGKRIASAGDRDKTVQVWDAVDGGHVYTYRGHSSAIWAVAWSPDSRRIVSTDGYNVQVWDAADGRTIWKNDHQFTGRVVAWSPDGKLIASADYQNGSNIVQVWDAADGGHVYTYRGHSDYINAVAWSPDGKRIASSDGHDVQVWNATDGGHVYTYRGHSTSVAAIAWSVDAVAWSPDGRLIASAGYEDDITVQVWNATDGGHVYTYHLGHSASVAAIAWSPDSKRIASAESNFTVQVWNATDGGHVYTYRGHTQPPISVSWSPDGKRIASAGKDGTVQVWEDQVLLL